LWKKGLVDRGSALSGEVRELRSSAKKEKSFRKKRDVPRRKVENLRSVGRNQEVRKGPQLVVGKRQKRGEDRREKTRSPRGKRHSQLLIEKNDMQTTLGKRTSNREEELRREGRGKSGRTSKGGTIGPRSTANGEAQSKTT